MKQGTFFGFISFKKYLLSATYVLGTGKTVEKQDSHSLYLKICDFMMTMNSLTLLRFLWNLGWLCDWLRWPIVMLCQCFSFLGLLYQSATNWSTSHIPSHFWRLEVLGRH